MKTKSNFEEVCGLLESGFTICEAIDELSLDSRKFYKGLSKEQRLILTQLRTAHKMFGSQQSDANKNDTKDLHEFFTTDFAY